MKKVIKGTIALIVIAMAAGTAGDVLQSTQPASVANTLDSSMASTSGMATTADTVSTGQMESTYAPTSSQTLSDLEYYPSYSADGSGQLASDQAQSNAQATALDDDEYDSPVSQDDLERQIAGYSKEANQGTNMYTQDLGQPTNTGIAPSLSPAFDQETKDTQNEKPAETSMPAGKKTMKCVCDVE